MGGHPRLVPRRRLPLQRQVLTRLGLHRLGSRLRTPRRLPALLSWGVCPFLRWIWHGALYPTRSQSWAQSSGSFWWLTTVEIVDEMPMTQWAFLGPQLCG